MNARGWNGTCGARRDVQTSPLLGVYTDPALALLLGCSATTVRYWRRKAGVLPASTQAHPRDDVGTSTLLGKKPDTEVALIFGCHRDTVRNWRKRLGIPAYNKAVRNDYR